MKRVDVYALIFGLIGFVIMVVFIILLIPEHFNWRGEISLNKASDIGSFIGGIVGVLFSIAAFLLLYETLNVQKAEIAQTNKQLQKQSFENNLFQMINVHNEFVREFDIQKGRVVSSSNEIKADGVIAEGRDSFRFIYSNFLNKNILMSNITNKDYIQSIFLKLIQNWDDDLNHYFKHSLEIVKYIKDSTPIYITFVESKRYASLFNSGLSTSEEILLFYYVVFMGNKSDKNTFVTLGFFDKLSHNKLLHTSHINWINE